VRTSVATLIALALMLGSLGSSSAYTPGRKASLAPVAGPNLVLNGGFEQTTAVGCDYNLTNASLSERLAHAIGFGTAEEIDLLKNPAGCSPSGPPHSGEVLIAVHSQTTGGPFDAVAMELASPVVAGASYQLTFFGRSNLENIQLDRNRPIDIGLSNDPNSFGTLVLQGTPTLETWQEFTGTVIAPHSATYLTLRQSNFTRTWNQVDDLSLVLTSPVSARRQSWGALKAFFR
jgi:hypothetical protein